MRAWRIISLALCLLFTACPKDPTGTLGGPAGTVPPGYGFPFGFFHYSGAEGYLTEFKVSQWEEALTIDVVAEKPRSFVPFSQDDDSMIGLFAIHFDKGEAGTKWAHKVACARPEPNGSFRLSGLIVESLDKDSEGNVNLVLVSFNEGQCDEDVKISCPVAGADCAIGALFPYGIGTHVGGFTAILDPDPL